MRAASRSSSSSRILSAETVERATACQVEVERDGLLDVPRRYAMGFVLAGLPADKYGILSPRHVFGHGGHGSIGGWADPREDLAVAYVTNGIRDGYEHDQRVAAVSEAVRDVYGRNGPTTPGIDSGAVHDDG